MSIDERPEIVEKRQRQGDWEVNTIIGKNHKKAIVTMTERVSRSTYLCKVKTKDAKSVEKAIVGTLKATGLPVLTITADNGREFGNHESIAKKLDALFYFAHAYSSWERGANENSNGLVRQSFAKGSDFSALNNRDMKRVECRLNRAC